MFIPYQKTCMAAAIALTLGTNISIAQGATTDASETANKITNSTSLHKAMLEEVVVTARKREQNLQDTPIAISAFSKQKLDDQKVNDVSDIAVTAPNIQIAPSPGGSTGATVAIRGAASINPAVTWEPSVGIYVDGVFVAKNVGGLFDVAELERVEVLRGPQGTLYGKNTTGGAINLITRKPAEEFGGKVTLGAGNYGSTKLGVTVDSGRVADVARFMVSYSKRNRDGFYDNNVPYANRLNYTVGEFKKLDSQAALITGAFDVSDHVKISYSYDWSNRDNTVAFGQPENLQVNGRLPSPKRKDKGALNGAGYDKSRSSGHNFQVTWDINDNLTLKSITSYRKMSFHDNNDYDGTINTGFHAERDVDHKQSSQEFQLIGKSDDINYVVGLYYFSDDSNARNPYTTVQGPGPAPTFGAVLQNFYGAKSESYAAFGQMDWLFSEDWTLTVGGRFTNETKKAYVNHPNVTNPIVFNPGPIYLPAVPAYSTKAKETWNEFSPMAVISYAFTKDINTYAKISQGWRAGGFNGESATKAEAQTPYNEETSVSYELGLKAQWFESQLQTNLAIFQNNIKDMQLSAYDFHTGYSKIENAGKARIRGLELETLWAVSRDLTAFFNYGYLDGQYLDFIDPVTGLQEKNTALFAYTPRNKYSLGLSYVHNLSFAELHGRLDYSYTGDQVFYRDPGSASVTASPSYYLLNARIAFTNIDVGAGQSLEVDLWGKNLTDEEYRLNGIPAGAATGLNYYGDPRTFGVDVTYHF